MPPKQLLPHQDAYGQNIYESFISGKSGYDIVEREDGHFSLNGDSDAYTIPFEQWECIQQQIAPLVKGKILDIGCGGGKHAIHFQDIGYDVTGIDSSPLAIQVCQMRGLQKALVVDIQNIPYNLEKFDTILMLGNNVGLLSNEKKAHQIFKTLYKITTPTAVIFAETLDPYGKAFDNIEDRQYQEWNRARGRMSGQIKIRIRYKKFVTPWSDYLFLSKEELSLILQDTGWQIARFFDEPKFDQYIAQLIKN